MKRLALLCLVLSGCTVVGYPAGAPDGPTPASSPGGPGADGGVASADLPVEELSPRGNPPSYEQFGETYHVLDSAHGYDEEGVASWYGEEFAGRPTSSGEIFDPALLTAAHRTLPLPTWAEVTNLANGRRVIVRINDRGPFVNTERRIIDLSRAAARRLDLVGAGVGRVRVRALTSPVRPGS